MQTEVKAPLASTRTLLERLLECCVVEAQRILILLIISQVNFLLCTVDDYLDLGRIQRDCFNHVNKVFKPTDTLEFITGVFKHNLEISKKSLTFEFVDGEESNLREGEGSVPEKLLGDEQRLI